MGVCGKYGHDLWLGNFRLVFLLWLRCGCMLLARDGCGCGPVRFSVGTGALVLRWLTFRHSYGVCGKLGRDVVRQLSPRILAVVWVRVHID